MTEATSLSVGDLVVHSDHGIGRFAGLQTITALGAPHDCLELHYAGGDKLFLPVENIELLSRYGSSDEGDAQLDRLGGVGWQTRKAKLKKRLREIANELIKVAALRAMREAPVLLPPTGTYDEFVARFPYEETRRSGGEHRSGAGRSRFRQADGPARLRRRRLRQDGSRHSRRVRCGDERPASRGRGADDVACAAAFPHFQPALPGSAGQNSAGVAHGRGEGAWRGEGRAQIREHRYRPSAHMRCSAKLSSSRGLGC